MSENQNKYSKTLTDFLKRKYTIVSAGSFLVVMLIAGPVLGKLGFTSLITQNESGTATTESTVPTTTESIPTEVPSTEPDTTIIDEGEGFDDGDFDEFEDDEIFNEDNTFDDIVEPQDIENPDGEPLEFEEFKPAAPEEPQEPREPGQFDELFREGEFKEFENQDQDKVCGQDGITYDTEEALDQAGAELQHFGPCHKADEREIREMAKNLKNWRFDSHSLKNAERALKRVQKLIASFEKALEKAAKNNINGEFTTYVQGKIDKLTTFETEITTNITKSQTLVLMGKNFVAELQNRLELVKSGERSSQYFWNYTNKGDFFWFLMELNDRRNDVYNQGYYDMLKEFVRQRYEAAKQGVSAEIDWSVQDTLEQHFTDQSEKIKGVLAEMEPYETKAMEIIQGTDISWEEADDLRQDLNDARDTMNESMQEVWDADRDFWDSEPWKLMEKIWRQIDSVRESGTAMREIEKIKGEIGAVQNALSMAKELMKDNTEAVKTIDELLALIDQKVLPALEKVVEKAKEEQNPELIWRFFEHVLQPLERFIEPKMEFLSKLYFSKYRTSAANEQRKVLDPFFREGPGGRDEISMDEFDEFEFDDQKLKDHFVNEISKELKDEIMEKVMSRVSSEVLESLSKYDKEIGIDLENVLKVGTFADEGKFKDLLKSKEEMSATIAELQEEMSKLKSENKELKNHLKEIAAYNLYGSDDFRKELENIDVKSLSKEEVSELEKKFEVAKKKSLKAKCRDKVIPFCDTDDDQWFTEFVAKMASEGIVSGYKDERGKSTGEYGPGNSVTNAEFTKMLLNSTEKGTGTKSPKNIKAQDHWARGFYSKAEELNLSLAKTIPDDSASRCTVAKGIVEILDLPLEEYEGEFQDVPQNDSCASYVATVKENGIMTGDSTGKTFRPYEPLNRAEVAKVIDKVLDAKQVTELQDFDTDAFFEEVSKVDREEEEAVEMDNREEEPMEEPEEEFVF